MKEGGQVSEALDINRSRKGPQYLLIHIAVVQESKYKKYFLKKLLSFISMFEYMPNVFYFTAHGSHIYAIKPPLKRYEVKRYFEMNNCLW